MSRWPAIAGLAIRSAVRSRLWAVLGALVAIAVLGLPAAIKSDGTAAGLAHILLAYTLSAAAVLIAMSVIWAGAGAISLEVRDRQMHLVMTKPVRPWELWLGKWTALALMSGLMCVGTGTAVVAMLHWRIGAEAWPADERRRLSEEIMVARRPLAPETPDLDRLAQERVMEAEAAGRQPEGVDREQLLTLAREAVRLETLAARPFARQPFVFHLPGTMDREAPAHIVFRFIKSSLDARALAGRWSLESESGTERWRFEGAWTPGARHSVSVPARAMAGSDRVTLTFENRDEHGAIAVFDPKDGVRLMVRAGGHIGNHVRGLLIIWFQIALLAAIGVTAGSMFSFPVAAFLSMAVALVTRMSTYVARMASPDSMFFETAGPMPAWQAAVERIWRGFFVVMNWVLAPARGADVLGRLSSGEWIGWGEVGAAAALNLLLGCGGLALLSCAILRRRELGGAAS